MASLNQQQEMCICTVWSTKTLINVGSIFDSPGAWDVVSCGWSICRERLYLSRVPPVFEWCGEGWFIQHESAQVAAYQFWLFHIMGAGATYTLSNILWFDHLRFPPVVLLLKLSQFWFYFPMIYRTGHFYEQPLGQIRFICETSCQRTTWWSITRTGRFLWAEDLGLSWR